MVFAGKKVKSKHHVKDLSGKIWWNFKKLSKLI